ncbi:MAG: hypothetical protein ABSH35_31555 [Isosphaeraceae bacterium]|jgi:hypothetical protein
MSLKSKEWFYKQCILEVDRHTQFEELSWDVMKKGIAQINGTRGHVTQSIGAIQGFLEEFPAHRATIRASALDQPFDMGIDPDVLRDWLAWFQQRTGKYGRRAFGYDYDTLYNVLTDNLGGEVDHNEGGAADDEFRRVLRLMAEFLDRT